jgi:hypothetical protein
LLRPEVLSGELFSFPFARIELRKFAGGLSLAPDFTVMLRAEALQALVVEAARAFFF